MKWFRWLIDLEDNTATARITQEQAIAIAQNEAARQGWEWKDRLHVWSQGGCWHITTNFISIGGNVRIEVDQQTGEIKHASWFSGCPAPHYVSDRRAKKDSH